MFLIVTFKDFRWRFDWIDGISESCDVVVVATRVQLR